MATLTFVELSLPEAERLAAFTGIEWDFRTAQDFAKKILLERNENRWNGDLHDALMTATLVRYARPFAKSKARLSLFSQVAAVLNQDQQDQHKYLMAVRNKYVVHSENAFEESRPRAHYWVERVDQEGINQISCSHHRIVGLSRAEIDWVIELTDAWLHYIKTEIKAEQGKLLAMVRAMPLSEVLNSTRAQEPLNPDPHKTRQSY